MATRLVQVGWWCEHPTRSVDDEPHPGNRPSAWTSTALAQLDYHDPEKDPDCPRAVPVYIEEEF